MEVFRKVLRRRPEKSGDDSLSTELGALTLHAPDRKDDLDDPAEGSEDEEEGEEEEEEDEFSRSSRWPSTTFKCVAGPGPKIKLLRSSLNEKRPRNEVARSNSFRFEKYEREPPAPSTLSSKVRVSDDYMTPKDFVNKSILPRLLEEDSSHNIPGNGKNDLINDILHRIAKNNGNDLYLELQYSDPSDSKLYTQPGTDPDDMVYKLYVGDEEYYCRPYKQSRDDASDVSTFYEDVVPHHISSDGRCVTIISVSNSTPVGSKPIPPPPPISRSITPCNRSITESPTITTSEASSDRGSFTSKTPTVSHTINNEPLYENLDFHRVKISVPGGGGGNPIIRNRRHMTPTRPRAKDDSVSSVDGGGDKKFEKFGYSRNEVWNWLYTEDENGQREQSIYSVPSRKKPSVLPESSVEEVIEEEPAKGEVEFSPHEFYSASTRLEHLNLEGFESFVSNTLEKVMAKRKKKTPIPKPVRTTKQPTIQQHQSSITHSKPAAPEPPIPTSNYCNTSKCSSTINSHHSPKFKILESIRSSSQSSHLYHQTNSRTCVNNNNINSINKQLTGSSGQSSVGSESLHHPLKKDSEGGSSGSTLGKPYQILEIYGNNSLYDIPKLSSVPSPMALSAATWIQPNISLDRQEWFHGSITRVEAESVLRLHKEGSYLVRNSESSRQDYSLSLKSSHGFMHMRIQKDPKNPSKYILGQFSKPLTLFLK
ncbi:unnamed protein product [Lepeophtheirus salmonis]|uniref:(salmon louse) hypothetical protein n=1 Tax=Lepeophtheirus salmonis TaxID=72036 RepID=A0A7R8CSP5_LEPSM|nr:unnamed protein product [Lepeophtheirus salmonis]CAF2918845.1 unnamed protein product [Lepeophtheirus salmonis]